MAYADPITADLIRSILDYDPDTGAFRYLPRADKGRIWNAKYPGMIAGVPHRIGYIQISVNGRTCLAHRLAWLWVHGEFPPDQIDHINCDKTDNRLCNLRLATHQQNMMNRRAGRNSPLGLKGVTFDPRKGRYVAQLVAGRKCVLRKKFSTIEEAAAAYAAAARQYHGEFARTA